MPRSVLVVPLASVPVEEAEARVRSYLPEDVGDSDPLQAIEDALRTFPADEIVVIAPPEGDTAWLESQKAEEARRRFGAPVTRLTAACGDTR